MKSKKIFKKGITIVNKVRLLYNHKNQDNEQNRLLIAQECPNLYGTKVLTKLTIIFINDRKK